MSSAHRAVWNQHEVLYVIKPTKHARLRVMPYATPSQLHTTRGGALITYQASFVGLDKELSNPIGLLNSLSLEDEKTIKPVISPSAKICTPSAWQASLLQAPLVYLRAAKSNRILCAVYNIHLVSIFAFAVLQEETSITRSVAHLSDRILYCFSSI